MPKTARKPKRAPGRHALADQLKDAIESRGLSSYALGKAADVDPGVIQRFLNGERDIRMETASRIAEVLKVKLVEVGSRRDRAQAAKKAGPAGQGGDGE